MHPVINGFIGFVQGRTLSINGLEVAIPREGFAYIAAELSVLDGRLLTRVREMKGENAERYSFMKIGSEQLENVLKGIEKNAGQAIPFQYASKLPRMKVTVN